MAYMTADHGYQYYADHPACTDCSDILEPSEYVSGLCCRCETEHWEEYQEEDKCH